MPMEDALAWDLSSQTPTLLSQMVARHVQFLGYHNESERMHWEVLSPLATFSTTTGYAKCLAHLRSGL